jgi:subtilase family serine protease
MYYKHAGVLVTVSSGDSGYGVEFPASSEFVMAVGGTNLAKSSSTRGWAEKAWSSAGSGCSAYITKPAWEKDTGCTKRMESDVSAVADPATGVAVYQGGWQVVGGTSAASPIVAGIFTLFNLDRL